jgi:poly-gamma-glutamate synthase PgsB/CapB
MVNQLFLLLILILLLTGFLVIESVIHGRNLKKIPLRITVSGTRGKTSVARTLASVFRSAGYRVMAKTTGSEAMYILPDGSEKPVERWGLVTILEQKKLIRKAIREGAECLVAEVMSIRPENHSVETQKLLKPHLTILTNFSPDHLDVVSGRREDIIRLYANDVYPASRVMIHQDESDQDLLDLITVNKGYPVVAAAGLHRSLNLPMEVYHNHQDINLDLVIRTSQLFDIKENDVFNGIMGSKLDIGRAQVFCVEQAAKRIHFASVFAANDPESTVNLIKKITERFDAGKNAVAGLLTLRSDRGERSRQWLDYLRSPDAISFSHLFITGSHTAAFCRKIKYCMAIPGNNPATITRFIINRIEPGTIVFGMGNIVGSGRALVEYWSGLSAGTAPAN